MYKPYPYTEKLVDLVIERLKNRPPKRILDMGCGDGVIARQLKDAFPEAEVVASDCVSVSRQKILNPDLVFIKSNMFTNITGKFDLIICNPNHQTLEEWERAGSVEPKIAFTDGKDGFSMIEVTLASAPAHLNKGGLIALEIGTDHAKRLPGWEVLDRLAVKRFD